MSIGARSLSVLGMLVLLVSLSGVAGASFDPAGNDGQIDIKDVIQVITLWRSGNYQQNADPSEDDRIGFQDLFIFSAHFDTDAPVAVSTPTPTLEPVVPTATPTVPPVGDTFNMAEYFPLDANSRWRFEGMPAEGGSPDDNFVWTTEGTKGPGDNPNLTAIVTVIKTTTDEPTDDRNGDLDFWFVDGDGNVFYHGYHNGKALSTLLGTVNPQDIIVNPPLKLGGRGQKIGDTVHNEGTATVKVQTFLGPMDVVGTISLDVNYDRFDPTVATPLGTFTNALHLTLDIAASVQTYNFSFKNSELWFKKNVGLVKQDQAPDPTDAEVQGISEGEVGGVSIVAN
jgi:hypothetical protein